MSIRIAVAFDRTFGAERALEAALHIAERNDGTLLLVRALNPILDLGDVFAPSMSEATDIRLHDWRKDLHTRILELQGVTAEAQVAVVEREQDYGAALAKAAVAWGADMIAVGSRRATGLQGALLGSCAHSLIDHSSVPVLVVHVGRHPD